MSEYQYYEFLAIDRPLDDDEQAEVRSASTRATITATSFVNEYQWGDFKGDPAEWMEHYYDAHLYVADWGTRRLMLRLPSNRLDPAVVDGYRVDDYVTSWTAGDSTVLDVTIECDPGDFHYDADELLSQIIDVRAELATGDLRPLYLAWLAAYGMWERDEDAFDRTDDDNLEPPVPPGLNTLTPAQRALSDFLRLDQALLTTAAQTSPPLGKLTDNPQTLTTWAANLPTADKNQIVQQILQGDPTATQTRLQRRFRQETTPTPPRRTVGTLLDTTAHHRANQ